MEESIQKIHNLLGKFDTAMLVTHGRDFAEHARPMGVARVEDNCDVWLVTGRISEKVRELEHDREVLLVFQKDHSVYLSINGRAQLVDDPARIKELWKESYRAWFPGGVEDPSLLLVRVSVQEADYWDATGWKAVKYLFNAAKAYVTGAPSKIDPDQHGRVSLK